MIVRIEMSLQSNCCCLQSAVCSLQSQVCSEVCRSAEGCSLVLEGWVLGSRVAKTTLTNTRTQYNSAPRTCTSSKSSDCQSALSLSHCTDKRKTRTLSLSSRHHCHHIDADRFETISSCHHLWYKVEHDNYHRRVIGIASSAIILAKSRSSYLSLNVTE